MQKPKTIDSSWGVGSGGHGNQRCPKISSRSLKEVDDSGDVETKGC